jgi:hypothetical protein
VKLRARTPGPFSSEELLYRCGFGALTLLAKRHYFSAEEQLQTLEIWRDSIQPPKMWDPLDETYVVGDKFDDCYQNTVLTVKSGVLSGKQEGGRLGHQC